MKITPISFFEFLIINIISIIISLSFMVQSIAAYLLGIKYFTFPACFTIISLDSKHRWFSKFLVCLLYNIFFQVWLFFIFIIIFICRLVHYNFAWLWVFVVLVISLRFVVLWGVNLWHFIIISTILTLNYYTKLIFRLLADLSLFGYIYKGYIS